MADFVMDPKLKAALIDKIRATKDDLKSSAVKGLLDKSRVQRAEKCAPNAQKMLYNEVRRKLVDRRLWTPIHEALAEQGFVSFLRKLEKSDGAEKANAELTAARAQQLALFPGFENLPVRILEGSKYVKLSDTPVPQFLSYEYKYQARASQVRQTADELHRLAELVRPFAETQFSLAQAFDLAQHQTPKLVVLKA